VTSFSARDVDATIPNAARMYDLWLGGSHNFEADHRFAQKVMQVCPLLPELARHNRSFLWRVVMFCADQGIAQFLDLGSGIPTVGNVHEIAHSVIPDARVVYVDIDPTAVATSQKLLSDNPSALAMEADIRDPDTILDHPLTQQLINFEEPLALLMVAVLPFISDHDRPAEIVARFRDRLPSGSYMAISHFSLENAAPEVAPQTEAAIDLYARTASPVTVRTRAELAEFFTDMHILEPGIVYIAEWRPANLNDPDVTSPVRTLNYAAIGYKP
jgi:S-adenosyl methyltransferase